MNHEDARVLLTRKLFAQRPAATKYDSYYAGTNPLAWIGSETADEIRTFGNLNVNYSRLVVDILAQKLEVEAFMTPAGPREDLYAIWESQDMSHKSQLVTTDALALGRAGWLVWAGPDGQPNITPESSLECAILRDPLTGATVAGLKRWTELDGTIRALLFTCEDVTEYVGTGNPVTDPYLMPTVLSGIEDLKVVSTQPNPFGVVPLVMLTNRPGLRTPDGESELVDIAPLVDAVNKLSLDMLITSSYSAFPRRYVTGLFPTTQNYGQKSEDIARANHQVEGAWENAAKKRMWIAPSADTRFGQFPEASLENYKTAIMLFLAQISTLGALPPQYMSLLGTNPQSADAIRAQEARLVAKAVQRQRQWSQSYEDLMRLAVQVRDGRPDPTLSDLETVWEPAEEKTLAQTADAVVKLYSANVIDRTAALVACGYSPQEITAMTGTEPINVIE